VIGDLRIVAPRLVALAVSVVACLGACATAPKPPELETLERLRADPGAAAAAKRAPDLVKSADHWLAKARQDWQENDIEDAVHEAMMGIIKLKQALALAEQDRGKSRIINAQAEHESAADQHQRLKRDLSALNEQVALLERLQVQAAERRKLEEQLSAEKQLLDVERQKATVVEKITEAELALKTAETVNAPKHAPPLFQEAKDLLARAQQEVQQRTYDAALVTAELAKKKADEAAQAAKPHYQREAESAESRMRAEALARDAAAIPRVVVRRDTRGSLQRLVIPIRSDELFRGRETMVAAGREAVLDSVAALVKKYPTYPVQVIGYTDSRGRSGELLALSLARAQTVYSALIVRGVDARRIVVSGQGSSEAISDNRTTTGRAQNNRVEVVFLYQ